jgi:hypothetical protein
MELKVFRLKEGKLEFIGLREPKAGDAIIEGSTSMAEVRPGVLALRESLDLKEASTSDFPLLFGTEPVPPTPAELAAAKKSLNDKGNRALADSYKQAHPGATEKEIDAFVQGDSPDPKPESVEASIKRLHPSYTDAQVKVFMRGQ